MSGFKGVRNENGRPKGALNKNNALAKELITKAISNELENLESTLATLEPKERLDIIAKFLPYILPKQSEVSVQEQEPAKNLVIRIRDFKDYES